MSAKGNDSEKRHRHDVGEVSHGAVTHEKVTRAIQYTLAMTVIGSALLVVYAMSAAAFVQ